MQWMARAHQVKYLYSLVLLVFVWVSTASAETLKVIAVADINSSLGSTTYRSSVHQGIGSLLAEDPDLVIGTGDYIAGEDIAKNFPISRFHEMWQAFQNFILSRILNARVEFAPSPGNHDASGYSSMKRERDIYVDFWNRNKPRLNYVDQQHYPYFYSYSVDGVFFISMDDVTPFRVNHNDLQRDWIREQLESPVARNARARIVYGHIPLYPLLDKGKYSRKGRGKYYEYLNQEHWEANEDSLEKIFLDNNVDLAVFGHSHTFFPGKVIHKRPDKTHSLRILSMPCMGSGSRYLSGTSSRSKTGYAVIEIDDFGGIRVEGFSHQGEKINKGSLPERIIVPGQYTRYYRDDIHTHN